jgi:acetyl-CoA acetyltransferase
VTAYLAGAGLTPFGRLPGPGALEWQAMAARDAMADARVGHGDIDAVICGYATTIGHLMPANLLAEYLGLAPQVAFGTSVGGATGLAMIAQAVSLIDAGAARCVLVAAGEDRASGQSRDASISVLAQVGHRDYEVPLGANIPAYYALLASAYLDRFGVDPAEALAPLAVQMRIHAARHPGAQFRTPVTADDVLLSRIISEPLHLLDCCPVSDGGAALVITKRSGPRSVPVLGMGQAHRHQHVSEADFFDLGARRSAFTAFEQAGTTLADIDLAGIYDSFTVTLAMLLEEIGFAEPGKAGAFAAAGEMDLEGRLPTNTHGGLLSYGHCGVGGGMAHLAELVIQLRGEAGPRQVRRPLRRAFVHADGGVLSAHVSAVLGAAGEGA